MQEESGVVPRAFLNNFIQTESRMGTVVLLEKLAGENRSRGARVPR